MFPRRFQIELLPDVAWPELRRQVVHSEAVGFDVASTADQFVDWKTGSPWYDVWVVLTAFAEATETIRLAPCVAQIPMRDPATFARQVLTIDHVSNGRIEAALGLGLTVDKGYDMMGLPNWGNRERVDRFGEYIHVVSELLTNGTCRLAGEFYEIAGAQVHPSIQDPRPPITIAAMGPRMMGFAAEHADAWNTMSFGESPDILLEEAASLKARMADTCERVGRDPSTLLNSFLVFDADARASGGSLFYYESADRFEDLVGQIFAMGYDEVGVYYPIDAQRDTFEEVAATVMPRLREA